MWKWMVGVFTFSEDMSVSDEGRRRYHLAGSNSMTSSTSVTNTSVTAVTDSTEMMSVSWSFLARRSPWCISVHDLADTPSVVAVSWGSSYTAVMELSEGGEGARFLASDEERGDLGLSTMLRPDLLRQLRPRGGNVVFAEDEVEHHKFPSLVTLGVTRYEAEISEELGVLLSWTSVIDERVATDRRIRVLEAGAG
jgi:hypothetical protein